MDERRRQRELDQAQAQIRQSLQQVQERSEWVAFLEDNEKSRQLSLAASKFQELKEREDSVTKLPLNQLLVDFNAIDPRDILLDSTRVGVEISKVLYEWFRATPQFAKFDEDHYRVLCVSCPPGSGQTPILLSVTRGLSENCNPKPSFSFCGSGSRRPDSATSVLKSLIFLLLEHQPQLAKHLTEKRQSTNRKQFSDPNDFYGLSLLLYDIIRDKAFKQTTFIVDGIDEFGDDGLDKFAALIPTTLRLSSNIKWLISVTSTESAIQPVLEHASQFNLDANDNRAELRKIFDDVYIPWKLGQLPNIKRHGSSSPDEVLQRLRELSTTNFLWADIACEAILQNHRFHGQETIDTLPTYTLSNMEPIYTHMFNQLKQLRPSQQGYGLRVLPALAVLYKPQRAKDLEQIIDPSSNFDMAKLVQSWGFAFLELCDETIYFRHASAREYIRRVMASELHSAHSRIVENCLQQLSELLKASGTGIKVPKKALSFADYAAVYWIRHLSDMNKFSEVEGIVIEFLGSSVMLKWVDLLSSRGKLRQAWSLMKDLRMKICNSQTDHGKRLLPRIYDTERFLQFHLVLNSEATNEARNTLLFSPIRSGTETRLLSDEFPQLAVFPGTSWGSVDPGLQGQSHRLRGCAYSHDGKFLISATIDGSVLICDTVTGKTEHSFRGFKEKVSNVAISATGLLAASDGQAIKLWDLATGKPHQPPSNKSLRNEDGRVHSLALSNDGTLLAASMGNFVNIWELPSYTRIVRKASFDFGYFYYAAVRGVKFSNDGKLLGTVSENGLTIWELVHEGQKRTKIAMEPNTEVTQSEGYVDGQEITQATTAAADDAADGGEYVSAIGAELETINGTYRLRLMGNFFKKRDGGHWADGFAFSPDSRYVALGMDGNEPAVLIWDLTSSAEPLSKPPMLLGHRDPVDAICFSADGSRLASGSKDGVAMIWKAPWDRNSKEPETVLQAHNRKITCLSFRPDQKHLAACLEDGNIRIWDYGSEFAQTFSELETTHEADNQSQKGISHTSAVIFVTSSKDGQYVASASLDGLICLWEAKSGTLLRTFAGHDKPVTSLVFSHDAKQLISASNDKTARIWDISGISEPRTLYGHCKGVHSIAIADDGKLVASGSDDHTVRVWDISRPELGNHQTLATANAGPENNGNGNRNDSTDEDGVRVLRGHSNSVACVAFSRDAKFVAAGSTSGKVLLWEIFMDKPSASHTHREMFTGGCGGITAVSFGPGVNRLIACSDHEIWVWDTDHVHEKGKPCERLKKLDIGYNHHDDDLCGYFKTAETSMPFHTLQASDKHPDYVMTALGPVCLRNLGSSPAKPESTSWCPYSVTMATGGGTNECWITRGRKKLICLPRPYRPSNKGECQTRNRNSERIRNISPVLVLGHTVVIGCGTGEVLFFGFKENYQSATRGPIDCVRNLFGR